MKAQLTNYAIARSKIAKQQAASQTNTDDETLSAGHVDQSIDRGSAQY